VKRACRAALQTICSWKTKALLRYRRCASRRLHAHHWERSGSCGDSVLFTLDSGGSISPSSCSSSRLLKLDLPLARRQSGLSVAGSSSSSRAPAPPTPTSLSSAAYPDVEAAGDSEPEEPNRYRRSTTWAINELIVEVSPRVGLVCPS
jgi:hypothetical protein